MSDESIGFVIDVGSPEARYGGLLIVSMRTVTNEESFGFFGVVNAKHLL